MSSLKYMQMKGQQVNNVETGILNKRNGEILGRKKWRRKQLDLQKLGNGKEVELCIVFNYSLIIHVYWLIKFTVLGINYYKCDGQIYYQKQSIKETAANKCK